MYLRFAVFVLAAAGTANIAMGFNSPGAILAQHHLARIKQDLKGSAIDASAGAATPPAVQLLLQVVMGLAFFQVAKTLHLPPFAWTVGVCVCCVTYILLQAEAHRIAALFHLQNVTHIIGFVCVATDAWCGAIRRRQFVIQLCFVRFIVAYLLIFGVWRVAAAEAPVASIAPPAAPSAAEGDIWSGEDAEMFSFRGVVLLLRTKGNGFIVGLWTELCTLFIVAAMWMVEDDQRRPAEQRLPRAVLGASVLLTCFVAGFGFWLYVLARTWHVPGGAQTKKKAA